MIEVQHLAKTFGTQEVLGGLCFAANSGQVTLLLGSNGVGKTTTLRILSGLLRPDSGEARICGKSIVHEPIAAQRYLSYLPQTIVFHPRLSCRTLLDFYAGLRAVPRERVPEMLALTGLEKEANKPAAKLSGGLRQRLGLAILLLPDTPVLLLDEPGLSLDPEWRQRLRDILHEEARRGKTVLVTTHLLAEWEGAAHRSLLCQPGVGVTEINPRRLRDSFYCSHENTSAVAA